MKAFIQNFLLLVFSAMVTDATYLIYFVENQCKFGNETLVYTLTSEASSIILNPAKNAPYSPNKTCTIILEPPEKHGIVLSVRKVDFVIHSNGKTDFLQVFHSSPYSPTTLTRFKFDLQEKQTFYSFGPMTLLYHAEPREIGYYMEIGFEVIITEFTYDLKSCEGRFHCDNKRCIEHSLTCDGHNNCGDLSDESRILCDKFPMLPDLPDSYIVIISICVLLFLFILSCTVFCCVQKTRNNSRQLLDTSSDESDISRNTTPYEAVHPSGYYISQNPAGSNAFSPVPYLPSVLQNDGGYSNPCFPSGTPTQPPPPYKP